MAVVPARPRPLSRAEPSSRPGISFCETGSRVHLTGPSRPGRSPLRCAGLPCGARRTSGCAGVTRGLGTTSVVRVVGVRELRRLELSFAAFAFGEHAMWLALLVYALSRGGTRAV